MSDGFNQDKFIAAAKAAGYSDEEINAVYLCSVFIAGVLFSSRPAEGKSERFGYEGINSRRKCI